MSQSQIVEHVLQQWVADARITHEDDVAYWRRRIAYFTAHAIAYQDEHRPRVDWVEPHTPRPLELAVAPSWTTDATTNGLPR